MGVGSEGKRSCRKKAAKVVFSPAFGGRRDANKSPKAPPPQTGFPYRRDQTSDLTPTLHNRRDEQSPAEKPSKIEERTDLTSEI